MSIIENRVLTKYVADTSEERRAIDDLIRKVDQLKAKEAEAARSREQHFDALILDIGRAARAEQDLIEKEKQAKTEAEKARRESGEQHREFFQSISMAAIGINQAFEMIGRSISFAKEVVKGWGEDLRLEATNAGISIDVLSDAFQGLVDDDALNQFAAKAANGALKLTQQQMEDVGRAAVALRERGFDLTHSLEVLTNAAVTGKTKGLKELGISAEEGSNRIQTTSNMMKELNKVIAESHGPTSQAADDVDRLSVKWANLTDELKNYSAQAIIAASVSLDPLAMGKKIYEQDLRKTTKERLLDFDVSNSALWGDFNSAVYGGLDRGRAIKSNEQAMRSFAGGFVKGKNSTEFIEMDDDQISDADRKKYALEAAQRSARAILKSAVMSVDRNVADALGNESVALRLNMGIGATPYRGKGEAADNNYGGFQIDEQKLLEQISKSHLDDLAEQESRGSRYASSATRRNKSRLEEMFGPVDDFNAYTEAFNVLGGAVTTAMDAWIDGSASAGDAVKKFIGQALKGLASQMAVEALKHGAYAIGSLAFGDVRGASTHAAAAAAFGGAAVAAAVAAKELGGGGASGARGGGGGANTGGSGGGSSAGNDRDHRTGGGGGGRTIVYVYGDSFSEESPRQRALTAERAIKKVMGGSGGTDS